MGQEPAQVERQIESTRARLGADVEELTDRARPSRIAERTMDRAKGGVVGLRDRVMGSASDATDGTRHAVDGSVDKVRGAATGNPLAAGLIAFGVGWLVASVLPVTDVERKVTRQVEDTFGDGLGKAGDELKARAQDAAADLREPAKEAATAVKDKAVDAAQTTKQEVSS
jgi:hypothetical protein